MRCASDDRASGRGYVNDILGMPHRTFDRSVGNSVNLGSERLNNEIAKFSYNFNGEELTLTREAPSARKSR
ncbi:MAG: hypothetical protein WB681_05730 [Candidatus Cybelea sp.]